VICRGSILRPKRQASTARVRRAIARYGPNARRWARLRGYARRRFGVAHPTGRRLDCGPHPIHW